LLPELRLIVHVLPTAVQLRALAANHIDFALVIGPVSAEGIMVELLWSEALVVALPRDHALVRQPSMALSALRNEIFILPDLAVSPGYHGKLIELCRARGFEPLCSERAFHLETWLSLVESGFGIALIPASVDTTRHAHVATVRLVDSDATIPIMAAWREGDALPALPAFVAVLKSSRRASPPLSPAPSRESPASSSGAPPASGQTPDRPQ
jgi:DNA-binding transcriptional LysR family regulator